jgi:hypothetical protein
MPSGTYVAHVLSGKAVLDIEERFLKQNVRTRCHILSPNGVLPMIIPVVHGKLHQSAVKEVLISYKEPWRQRHFRTIKAAYGRSAFFEYFEDDLSELYGSSFENLWQFNLATLAFIFRCMHVEMRFPLWDGFSESDSAAYLSDIAHPASMPPQAPYIQVFQDRFPFVSGLSCLDLVMNLGPQSRRYLLDADL